jgi:hypothetical protein
MKYEEPFMTLEGLGMVLEVFTLILENLRINDGPTTRKMYKS